MILEILPEAAALDSECFHIARTLPGTTNRLFRQLCLPKTKIDRLILGEASRS